MIWWMIKRSLFASIVFGASICSGLGGGRQGFSRHDRNREHELRSLAVDEEHRLEGTVWTHGFWTGLNYVAAASGQTQPKISMSSIVAEVEKACARKTSQTLASAVWTTYLGAKR